MPTIIMSKPASKLDASVKKKAFAFLEKLGEDDTAAGLHIEPIHNSADARVRTGRVDLSYRAVLFKMTGAGTTAYVFYGIWPHDEAIAVAKKTVLTVNPVNGITEIKTVEPAPEAPAPAHAVVPPPQPVPVAPPPARPTQDEAAPSSAGLLAGLGLDVPTLVDDLGLDKALATAAVRARDEDALLDLAASAVEWQGLALLDLAAGHRVEDVKAKLGMDRRQPAVAGTEDERLLEGLRHPAAQITFAYIESNEELRRVIEDGDFGAWRVFLHPEQRQYAQRTYKGPFRLSGGAGTGKTVVLLHRARMLARRDSSSRVLLTTFTTNLANAMRADLERLDSGLRRASGLGGAGVHVAGIDAIASAVLKRAGVEIAADTEAVLGVGTAQVSGRTPEDVWREVLDGAPAALPAALRSPAFLKAEYGAVVLPHLITTRAEYFKVRRPGRGVALDRAKRSAVWDVIEAYRARARVDGTIDFAEAATIAAAHLRRVASERGEWAADHVLVDEGQDLTPAHWALLRALVGEHGDDLLIAEDSHQRIYGQRVVLSQFGIAVVGRSRRLTLNYRTTAQNLAYAVGVLRGGAYVDLEEGAEASEDYRSARSGPAPRLLPCGSLTEELDQAADLVRSWVAQADAAETVAVLVRDRWQRDRVVSGLTERGVTVRAVDREQITPGLPVVMTMHRAKGTEFAKVLLFGVGEGPVPAGLKDEHYDEAAWADAMLRERSLVYVAATRARDELAVSWSGKPSGFLDSRSDSSIKR